MFPKEFTPKLFTILKEGISREQLMKDITAGVIVGIIAFPLALAFAIASGVSPEKGLVTAIIAGFIISAFGGSRVQIGGPTGAFIVVVSAVILKYGFEGLIFATFLAGFILILMGLARLGDVLKYISHALIVGFTSGIAVIIFSTQVKDFLGITVSTNPEFINLWVYYFKYAGTTNFWAVAVGVVTILTIILFQRLRSKIPGTLVAIILTTSLVHFLNIPVETVFSKFGNIPAAFPAPTLSFINFSKMQLLFVPAFTIALLGALESLLSAVVADGMVGGKHRSNMELIAQGGANIFSAVFGGLPATGAIARTAANVKNGGRTPIAGVIHVVTLLVIFLLAGQISREIPLACLAGILIVVAWNMSEFSEFITILKTNIYELIVLLTTFFLTLFADLSTAIITGFIMSVIILMKRMSSSVEVTPILNEKSTEDQLFSKELGKIPKNTLVFEINGPLFFGAVSEFINIENMINDTYKIFILRLRYVPIIDITGLKRLKSVAEKLQKSGIKLIISGANNNIKNKILSHKIIDKQFVFNNIKEALKAAKKIKA